jgi:hypothetical protein
MGRSPGSDVDRCHLLWTLSLASCVTVGKQETLGSSSVHMASRVLSCYPQNLRSNGKEYLNGVASCRVGGDVRLQFPC